MIAASQEQTIRAIAQRLRTRVSRGSHKSEVLELIDLLDAALTEPTEPAPSPAPAASPLTQALPPSADVGPGDAKPAEAVGGGAGDLPPGWAPFANTHRIPWFRFERDVEEPTATVPRYPFVHTAADPHDGWYWATPSTLGGYAPTMLQAMCAALGIELTAPPGLLHTHATYNGEKLCNSLGRESCARLALERYHARQQAEATANMPCVYCHGRGAYNDAEGVEYVCGSCNGTGANDGRRAPRAQPEPPPSAAALADALRDAAQALDTAASQLKRLAGAGEQHGGARTPEEWRQ